MKKKILILSISTILILLGIFTPGILLNQAKLSSSRSTGPGISAGAEQQTATTEIHKKTTAYKSNTGSGKGTKKSLLAKKIYRRNKKILVLVNAEHPLDQSYQAELQPICSGRLNASAYLYDSLVQMLADAGEEGFSYWIASAWRSREKQQRLVDEDVRNAMQRGLSYDEALAETYKETMPAGHSEHETGLALDILCSGNMNMDASQEGEAGNIWLRKNCFRYGFILRYPKEKEKITGVHYEPWHLRYVGKEAAAFLQKHDLTLEEYWQLL